MRNIILKTNKIIYSILLLLLLFNIGYTKEKSYILSNGQEIKLWEPDPSILTRVLGPSYGFSTGCGFCLMCKGNHILSQHNISYEYLSKIGYSQWTTLHDNLHNDPEFNGHIGGGSYGFGYGLSYPSPQPTPEPPSLFAPTPIDGIDEALSVMKLTKDDILYDLGCGDGRVLIVASKLFGCRTVGIDIDKNCVKQTKVNIKLNKLDDLIRVYELDITNIHIKQATVAFVYLQPDLSSKLKYLKDVPLVIAHDKPIPQLDYGATLEVQSKEDGRKHTFYFWKRRYESADFL